MKPEIEFYRILVVGPKYYVLTPYDLFARPAMVISGLAYESSEKAWEALGELYKQDYEEYFRLRKIGRTFPDNN